MKWTFMAVGLASWLAFAPLGSQVETIRVVTFNIHAGKDAQGADNLARIAETLIRLQADVVLLQEVDRGTLRSGGVDQLVELARMTEFHTAWGPSLDFQGGEYGIAILSRWPVDGERVIPLPVLPLQERAGGSFRPRSALLASVGSPAGVLQVLNTHLDPTPDDHHRRQEMDRLLAVADSLRSVGGRVLFGGDLNAMPESPVANSAREPGWVDGWLSCGTGDGRTYPAQGPLRRIDYIFFGAGLTCTQAQVAESTASDHRPLVVTLSITPSGAVDPVPGQETEQ